MSRIAQIERMAKQAGRWYVRECARLQSRPEAEVIDEALACDAEGCREAGLLIGGLSIEIASAVPLFGVIPSETLIQWSHEVEDEYRMRPRPPVRLPMRSDFMCPRDFHS